MLFFHEMIIAVISIIDVVFRHYAATLHAF